MSKHMTAETARRLITDPMCEGEAREVASEWHSGQFSALYKFASSGYLDSCTVLEFETVVRECENRCGPTREMHERINTMDAPEDLLIRAVGALDWVTANVEADDNE